MIRNLAAGAGAFTSNAFLVTGTDHTPPSVHAESRSEEDEPSALVDTGAGFDLTAAVSHRVDELETVVLTHTHPDHIGNLDQIRREFDIRIRGFDGTHDAVDDPVQDGDVIPLGGLEFRVIHTPGHAADHICLYAETNGVLFAGDLVFADGAFGRTDLPGGDRETLVRSINRLLRETGDIAELHPGHGPSTTDDPRAQIKHALRAASAQ